MGKLFRSEPPLPPADLSVLGTDFHSHLIPGIDDGAETLEQSLDLIERIAGLGYKKIITTPHVMSDFYRNTPEIIREGLVKVKQGIEARGLDVEVEAAAEYYLDFEFEESIGQKEILTFGDKYVLFELPFVGEPQMFEGILFKLQSNGYKPILAHPERYGFWAGNWDKYQEIADKGAILQLNLTSLSGHYSQEVQQVAEKLIEMDLIGAVGTDCHNQGHLDRVEVARTNKYLHQLLEKDLINKRL